MAFLWYGPFRYEEQTDQETTLLFERMNAAAEQLEHALGVYIFAVRDAEGKSTPCYVGKASKHDIGGRVMGHLNKGKFLELIKNSSGISLYLVAAVDESGQMIRKGQLSDAADQAINRLEMAFIGSAHARNESLLNIRGKRSEAYVPIPGHISPGTPGADHNELAALLGFELS